MDGQNVNLSDYDYVWVHSQVLPTASIQQFCNQNSSMPKFIFLHMSKFDWIPDEQPYIWNMENRLSYLSLFISEEVDNCVHWQLDSNVNVGYFRNPAPVEFGAYHTINGEKVSKALIVTNHPTDELIDARKIMHDMGVESVMMGDLGEQYRTIDASLMSEFDVVISIGKTVQYCLTMGKPVYIYDKFGGDGYLNDNNFDKAMRSNFSGRSGRKKSPSEIANELINGYHDAKQYQTRNRKRFIKLFQIDYIIKGIIVKDREITPFSKRYAKMVENCQVLARNRFAEAWRLDGERRCLLDERKCLLEDNQKYRKEIEGLKSQVESTNKLLSGLKDDYNSIKYTSLSYIFRSVLRKLKRQVPGKRGS